MSTSQQQTNETDLAFGPKCPSCSGRSISYTEVVGPAECISDGPLKSELDRLKKGYAQRFAEAKVRRPSPDERAAGQTMERIHAQRLKTLRQELGAARQHSISHHTDPRCRLAVIHCTECGHVLGTANAPSLLAAASDLQRAALTELMQAIIDLQAPLAALAGSTAGVRGQVSALNAREEARDKAARLNAAAIALNNLFGG